ncbi:hypothetical protein JTE90_007984 [Oedothorax gibbosus]|uniref:Reverse transcriptase/retrotransposon-derived protein RNase H-like domain-containing protein n=1 Tax=Oedothorax gibbosus TaxID=931172 RepID=A0AAV6UXI8_9ARAC|nr:hypothetical protein JTE90_007984 [Oedothorax gibbosus]
MRLSQRKFKSWNFSGERIPILMYSLKCSAAHICAKTDPSSCPSHPKCLSTDSPRNSKSDEAFDHLKSVLTSASILAYSEPDRMFILDTDASKEGIGAVLSQEVDGKERVIAYFARACQNQRGTTASREKSSWR